MPLEPLLPPHFFFFFSLFGLGKVCVFSSVCVFKERETNRAPFQRPIAAGLGGGGASPPNPEKVAVAGQGPGGVVCAEEAP